jgi:hypothetical protein
VDEILFKEREEGRPTSNATTNRQAVRVRQFLAWVIVEEAEREREIE